MSKFKRMAGGVTAALVGMTVASTVQAQLPEHLRNYQLAARKGSGIS
ncbi:MAG: hypothetical protein R3F26_05960 [Gammaproteobacteria bacterium]